MLNIALCDDVPILCEVLETLIHQYEIDNSVKFNLFLFGSGEELLEKFDEDKDSFDLFFLHYYMKKMNGVETALHIRQYSTTCKIVFVTASDAYYEFMKAVPLAILHKPVKKEQVYSILDEVLAGKDN